MFKKVIYGIFYVVILLMILPFVAISQFMNSYQKGIESYIKEEQYDEILKYESSFYDPNILFETTDTTHFKLFINNIYMLNTKKNEDEKNSYTRYIHIRFININLNDMLLDDDDKDNSLIRLTFENNIKESDENNENLNVLENELLFNTYKDSNFLINQLIKVDDYRNGSKLIKIEVINSKGIEILNADLDIDFANDITSTEIESLEEGMTFNEVFNLYFNKKETTVTIIWFLGITVFYGVLGYFIFRKKKVEYKYIPRNPRPTQQNYNRTIFENKNNENNVLENTNNEENTKEENITE